MEPKPKEDSAELAYTAQSQESPQISPVVEALRLIVWLLLGGGLITSVLWIIVFIVWLPCSWVDLCRWTKIVPYLLVPFDKIIGAKGAFEKGLHPVLLLMWVCWLPFGVVLAIVHLFFAGLCAITYFGLPFAKIHRQMIDFALVGAVDVEVWEKR